MKILIYTTPVALLIAYSQIIVKWRVGVNQSIPNEACQGWFHVFLGYISDPFILSGYVSGLLGSFVWLFVVAKLPLAVAFPVYIGLTFVLVIAGSVILLDEPMSMGKTISVLLILMGVLIGSRV